MHLVHLLILPPIIMGIIQGATEFIPVSSSGHLIIASHLLRLHHGGHLFIQALDFGTTLALIIYFRRQLKELARQVFIEHDYRLLRNIAITCLPVGMIGFTASRFVEHSAFFASSLVIAVSLIIFGIIMVVLERLPRLSDVTDGRGLSPSRALVIGMAQCLALVPGVSRSGSTIIASRLCGLKPKQATEYSFLASIPIMLALLAKLVVKNTGFIVHHWQPLLLGNIFAFIVGIIAVRLFLTYLEKHDLRAFGAYRISVAIIIIYLLSTGALPH